MGGNEGRNIHALQARIVSPFTIDAGLFDAATDRTAKALCVRMTRKPEPLGAEVAPTVAYGLRHQSVSQVRPGRHERVGH